MTTVSTVGNLSSDVSLSRVKGVDRHGDQHLPAGEFASVLNRLVGELAGSQSTRGLGSEATAIGKVTDLTHDNSKHGATNPAVVRRTPAQPSTSK
jgi:hypothetical protein